MTARYQFVPWVREGAATAYVNADPLTPVLSQPGGRPLAAFPVELKINDRTSVDVSLRMYGPGDVTGIDPRLIIRTDPPPRSADLEPNLLACIEFDPPDFPWLFTPAAAGRNGRLRPWLVLVVLPEADASVRYTPELPLPVLTAPAGELPDLDESWAWAHAQAVQTDETQPLEQILAAHPHQNLSRLICPRRLEPQTRYLACLVPAFEAGRKAGLGTAVTEEDENRLAPAWDDAQPQIQLPVYYQWTFGTGTGGDFESLARRLQGRELPAEVGRRSLLVSGQPFGLPNVGRLMFEGPLLALGEHTPPVVSAAFQNRLRDLLNLNASAAGPVVTPPVYGSWQATQSVVPEDTELPRWLRELNLDPALRSAAGLGVQVVRERQEQLVAAAWDQLGDAPEVARLERRLDVAVAVLDSVIRRRVAPMETGRMVQFLGPAQTRLRAAAETPSQRAATTLADSAAETLHAWLVRQGLPPSFSSASFRRILRPAGTLARRRSPAPVSPQRLATRVATAVPAVGPPASITGLVTEASLQARSSLIASLPPPLRDALAEVESYFRRFARQILPASVPPFQFTSTVKANLVASLDPQQSVPRRFYARVSAGGPAARLAAGPGAGLAQPSFPQPMFEALRDLSPELLLPGIGKIEADTVTLLDSNPRFIEAFMLGLNHELAAELIWREFPSDVRHTYFHRFWDTRGVPAPVGQLPPIHTWAPPAALGSSFAAGENQLVLLIRGELLQRYPDALIYAVKARTLNTLGTEEKLPIFRGRIEPDITFLGFDLTEEKARGSGVDNGWFFVLQEQPSAPRFGLDEARVTELSSWNDLAWSDLQTVPGAHLRLGDLRVPVGRRPPDPVWCFNAAHMAAILRQRPIRVAFHARRLLPSRALPVAQLDSGPEG